MESRNVIVRHGAPSVLDESEYGTVCIHKDNKNDSYEIYLQVNSRSMIPKWELMGEFNSKTPQGHIDSIIHKRLQEQ